MPDRIHRYHADATILSGNLSLPLVQQIEPQAHAHLREEGGYLSERVENYRVESVLSFRSAYTHVAGNPNTKPGKGWTTLTTTVVEGLNVLDVVTADRVVGQTITDYPLEGYIPSVSFLGTRFENLRIAGHAVEIDIDPNILGEKPANDAPYTRHDGVLSRVRKQYDRILGHGHLPEDLGQQYNRLNTSLGSAETLECSLVNQASGRYPGHSFGHKVRIPGFGEITLAKLTVEHADPHPTLKTPQKTTVHLTMVEFKLGCVIEGVVSMGRGGANGQSIP
ncbi:MAG TPA: choice-of-anchor P family protein [Terracidiphilus sp.]|jgi:hypothetical protein|nr:choice-of-anchor P family protein [Terracidiphilus sp.]